MTIVDIDLTESGLREPRDPGGPAGPPAVDEDGPPDGDTAVRPWRTPRRIRLLLCVNAVVAAAYVGWWLLPGHVGTPALFALLALAEAFTFSHVIGLWWTVWHMRIDPPPPATRPWAVDVLIPTYGEPLDVLRPTIAAAVGMDGSPRVHVLDDARRPEVQELAHRLGARYVTRVGNQGAKAGNINAALPGLRGDLVVVFDADHVPRPGFLGHLLGYFEDPDVAFVQTPQYYGNASASDVARGAYQQQATFYGPICRGKNGLRSAFCCGTNVVFRRAALDDVGGFDEASVVEDFVTSMHLHRRGWRSVYFPYILAAGLGPTNLRSYLGQQLRWAQGSIGAFLTREPFKPGLDRAQRVQYLLATTFYLTGLVTTIYVSLPILFMFFGWSAFSPGSGSYVFFYGPYLVLGLATLRWGLGRQLRLEHLQYTFGAFPVYALAALSVFLRRRARFNVTSKEDGAVPRPPAVAYVTVATLVATVVALVVGPFLRPVDATMVTNVAWGIVNVVLLAPISRVTLRETWGSSRWGRPPAANDGAKTAAVTGEGGVAA
jgi:cellulose synthase (UDP-forming)